jgi:hypothetical protein
MYQLKLWGVLLSKMIFVCPPEITDVHHRNQIGQHNLNRLFPERIRFRVIFAVPPTSP